MTHRSKAAFEILLAAVVLGLLGNGLLRQTPWGLNVLLFNLAFAGALFVLLRRHAADRLTTQTYALLGALVFFASMFVWRDSNELRVADTFAIIGILGILFLPTLKVSTRIAGVIHYGAGVVWAGFNAAFSAVPLLGTDISWNSTLKAGWSRHLVAAVRGVLVAAPLVLIFGGLFMAADAMYEGWVKASFNVNLDEFITHLLLFSFFAWTTAGYFRGIVFLGTEKIVEGASPIPPHDDTPTTESRVEKVREESGEHAITLPESRTVVEHLNAPDMPAGASSIPEGSESTDEKKAWNWATLDNTIVPGFRLGRVEVGVILGLVNAVFLSFVVFQVQYLFGGMDVVQSTPDFKLAEYARRGFGELVAVSAIVLPMLLAGHWLLKKEDRFAGTLFTVLAGVQIALLFVVMASAVQRLVLLTGNLGYGLTTVRLYPMIFMSWLAIVFILFAVTVLRGARQHFAWAALWSAFLVLGATHVLNPDAFIVKTNITLMQQGREFDGYYGSQLSDDAVPVLLEALPTLPQEDVCAVAKTLSGHLGKNDEYADFRSFNFSRSKAGSMLVEMESRLFELREPPCF
ncbi:MAG: DUF4173 domain-containing protein [Blastocatellia bacterium]|nr:DUF4173 domain-containing protein [Blastocatellia bacterium]